MTDDQWMRLPLQTAGTLGLIYGYGLLKQKLTEWGKPRGGICRGIGLAVGKAIKWIGNFSRG